MILNDFQLYQAKSHVLNHQSVVDLHGTVNSLVHFSATSPGSSARSLKILGTPNINGLHQKKWPQITSRSFPHTQIDPIAFCLAILQPCRVSELKSWFGAAAKLCAPADLVDLYYGLCFPHCWTKRTSSIHSRASDGKVSSSAFSIMVDRYPSNCGLS